MFSRFTDKIKATEFRNFRILNVFAALIVTLLGFIFEFAYHDGYILGSGLVLSMLFTLNYFVSFYRKWYRRWFIEVSYTLLFLLHFWAIYVAYTRNFAVEFLLPVSISCFTFSLVFNRFYKSLLFIFTITSFLFGLMYFSNTWQATYTIALVSLYSGAFISDQILKRKDKYHQEIRQQETRNASLMENMNDGLIYTNSKQEIVLVNDRFCTLTGFRREEIIGKNIRELNSLFAEPGNDHEFQSEILSGTSLRYEAAMRTRNNELIYFQVSGSPVMNDQNKIDGTMLVCTDISDLKHTQSLLKKREEGYRTFIDQSAVGIWKADYEKPVSVKLPVDEQVDLLLNTGYISECNDFMARMYGYSVASDLVGKKIRDFYYIENNYDSEKTKDLLKSFIMHDYRIHNAESMERDKHGVVRFMLNNNIGIIENGFLVRTWGVQTDITDRKNTERELVETNQELDTFFYKASHDLKGPLASVMGIVNLARLENKDQGIESYFTMIDTSIKRLDRTLLDLIELARTRKGSSKLTTVHLAEFVAEILRSLEHLDIYPKINFEIKINPDLEISGDKVLLLSIFQNLFHNAIHYCNHQSPWIRIAITEHETGIELEVSDNGRGIAEKVKSRVFEMFYRGNPDSSGSGLGLFIVKNALDKMKGKIRFDSFPGKGTSFFVFIPKLDRTE